MKRLFKILLLIVFATNVSLLAQTLTVTSGTPTLDGVITSGEYSSTPLVTALGVTLYAMDDGENLYLAATWDDATESINKKQWTYDGAVWSQSGNEDRLGFIFDMGLNDPEGVNCQTMCHPPLMHTTNGFVDVWHWKANRSNPMGVADDKRWETDDRHSDPGTSSYSDNADDGAGNPSFMGTTDPGANLVFLASDNATVTAFDPYGTLTPAHTVEVAVPFDLGASFNASDVVPGYVLRVPDGDRANVKAAGKWDNGVWTVEFKRTNSGSNYDFTVTSGGSVDFTHEIFDNEGGDHATNGIDPTVYTLDFVNIVSVQSDDLLPEKYVLGQNYPNPFNPTTKISYSLPAEDFVTIKVYDLLGNEIAILIQEEHSAGNYSVTFDAANIPSGVYFYQLESGNFVDTKKLILLK